MIGVWTARLARAIGTGGAALLGLAASGCGGDHRLHDLLLFPRSTDMQASVVDLRISDGVDAAGGDQLLAIDLTAVGWPAGDLSFFSTLECQAILPTGNPTLATLGALPAGTQSASMDIAYLGPVKPLFVSPDVIRAAWTATIDPSYSAWPSPDGAAVEVEVVIGSR